METEHGTKWIQQSSSYILRQLELKIKLRFLQKCHRKNKMTQALHPFSAADLIYTKEYGTTSNRSSGVATVIAADETVGFVMRQIMLGFHNGSFWLKKNL